MLRRKEEGEAVGKEGTTTVAADFLLYLPYADARSADAG